MLKQHECEKRVRDREENIQHTLCISVRLRICWRRDTSFSVMDTLALIGEGNSKLMMGTSDGSGDSSTCSAGTTFGHLDKSKSWEKGEREKKKNQIRNCSTR
jgi:hypothetical protein